MCLHPIKAELQEFGRPKFHHEGSLSLPCGKCTECISQRAIEWATRARHEIALHNENCFLTLTYNDENLPSHLLVKDPFQKFIKRLRKKTKNNIRYMVSHEYGSQFFRPHHHAIIFGYNPQNQTFLKNSPSGEKLFTSPEIESLWENGYHSIGTANERTAYYIASYALKGAKHSICLPNGEITKVSDQFDCSRRPAIGLNFLLQNQHQLVNSGNPLPRYYAKKLQLLNPELFEEYENNKISQLKTRSSHELYAKHTLDQYKKTSLNNEFRSTSEITQEDVHRKQQLKTNRDEYHRHIKGN